jgi:membrane protein insertase Oxa1/YidC/SpoIIIJ
MNLFDWHLVVGLVFFVIAFIWQVLMDVEKLSLKEFLCSIRNFWNSSTKFSAFVVSIVVGFFWPLALIVVVFFIILLSKSKREKENEGLLPQ